MGYPLNKFIGMRKLYGNKRAIYVNVASAGDKPKKIRFFW